MLNILEIKNINKSYSSLYIDSTGKKGNETNAVLYDLSLNIPYSRICALIGGNGAGKTTLFNIICGYLTPDAGEVIYMPKGDVSKYELTKFDPWNTSKIGIGRMFQTPRIFKNLTILENVMIADDRLIGDNPIYNLVNFAKIRNVEKQRREQAEVIFANIFGQDSKFSKMKNTLAGALSYGEQRLLSLARLLMNKDLRLVLLDEPCAGVNIQLVEKISEVLQKIARNGISILLIEHNIEFVRNTSDMAFYLEDGKVSISGFTKDVLDNDIVKQNYLV